MLNIKNFYNEINKNNKKLNNCLNILKTNINKANTMDELLAVVETAKSFEINLNYNVFPLIVLLTCCILGEIIAFSYNEFSPWWVVFCVVAIIILTIIVFQKNKTRNIVKLFFVKKIMLDNKLVAVKYDKTKTANDFGKQFFDFQRGNHSREIHQLLKGKYQQQFSFHFFHFHFVDENTSTSTDSDGRTTTTTHYYHHDRYGIIVPCSNFNFIGIYNYKPKREGVKWTTSSIQFNKIFKTYAEQEKDAARFLTPQVIMQFENIADVFSNLNVEISKFSLLCLSTDDQELLNFGNSNIDLNDLNRLKYKLNEVIKQDKFYIALEFLNFLRKKHNVLC